MDPLSITASAIALMQAASAVSTTLYKVVTTFRNADTKVSALCHELSTLINFLGAVDQSLKECCERPLSRASMDEDLWHQIAISLADCKTTLGELETFIERIKVAAKSSHFFRRAKIAVDLTIYGRDISSFQEKIHKSNWALQTMLSAITVSLSLRGNVAQETILDELDRLKFTIEKSLQVSLHHNYGLSHALGDPSDAHVAHNLQNLARVAQNFHSNASSTASTIHGANGTTWNVQSDTTISVRGCSGLTLNKRRQIDRYFKSMRRTVKGKPLDHARNSVAAAIVPPPAPAISSEEGESNVSEMGDDNDEGDDEAEYELLLVNGLEEVAKESMLSQDFAKAETFLEKAIQRHAGSSSGDADFEKLQIQLAICYFFQRKWRLAEPLVTRIAKSKAKLDGVVCNLLHALALAHLADYNFDKSITVCKQALGGKRRLKRALGAAHATECNETLGLLATIYETKGDPMYAEVLRRRITAEFSYEHPLNELEFIVKHPKLSYEVFGEKITLDWTPPQAMGRKLTVIAELPNTRMAAPIEEKVEAFYKRCREGKRPLQTLRSKLDLCEKFNIDTEKEVVVISIPSSASNSSEEFSMTHSSNSGRTSSSPKMAPKRSFTRKIVRFLGNAHITPKVSSDEWAMPPTAPPLLGRKLGKAFWPKSHANLFSINKSRTRLRKFRASDETQSDAGTMDNRRWVMSWLRSTPADAKAPTVTTDDTPTSPYDDDRPYLPEMGEGQVHEMMDTSRPGELHDTGVISMTTFNILNSKRNGITASASVTSHTSYFSQASRVSVAATRKSAGKFERGPGILSERMIQTPSPHNMRRWLRKAFWPESSTKLLTLKESTTRLCKRANDEKVKLWLGIGSGDYLYDESSKNQLDVDAMSADPFLMSLSEVAGSIRRPSRHSGLHISIHEIDSSPLLLFHPIHQLSENVIEKPTSPKVLCKLTTMKSDERGDRVEQPYDELKCSQNATLKRPKLAVIIPNFNEIQGDIPLIAHYPRTRPQSPMAKTREGEKAETAHSTAPDRSKTMAKVLYDFQGENVNELVVKKNELIQIIRRASKGWLLCKKSGQIGFVPAAYVDAIFLRPDPVETRKSMTRLKRAPKRLSEHNLAAVYDSMSKKKLGCSHANGGDSKTAQLQEVKLSWECQSEKEKLCTAPEEPDLELASVGTINNRLSWCSKDSDQFTYRMRTKSDIIFATASLSLGERDNMPRYQLMDNGVPDELPVLPCPGQVGETSHKQVPSFKESLNPFSSSNSSGSVLQDDPITKGLNIVENDQMEAQIETLLASFSSLCLQDDPEKSILYANPPLHRLRYRSKWDKMRRKCADCYTLWAEAG